MNEKIGVIGLWHLGCIVSASWAKLGYHVTGFDYDNMRVQNLKKGIPPIYEPDLEKLVKVNIERNMLNFSNDINTLSECDFIFLCYDTPVRDDDSCDTSILEKSVNDVIKIMKNSAILIVSSQSPVGYCSELRIKIKDSNSTLDLAYSPENLRLGEAISCYLNPSRIILGTANEVTEAKCVSLFNNITNEILRMNLESAEMVKHGINSFLAMSIVYANHLADICEEKGARIDDVIRGIKSDSRIGQKAYLSPGIGFSGGTLGRDLKVLDSANNETKGFAKIFGIIHELNSERKNSILSKTEKILNGLEGKTLSILGLTYKPNTSTLRRSLPLEIVDLFQSKKAMIKVYDPKADYSELTVKPEFQISKSIDEVATKSDILILLTEWEDFKNYDWSSATNLMNNKIFFDTKNFLDESKMKKFGFNYYSIGRY
jgi:UDPglucose 6-dehydrogenase